MKRLNHEDVASEPYITRGDDAKEKAFLNTILCSINWWRYNLFRLGTYLFKCLSTF